MCNLIMPPKRPKPTTRHPPPPPPPTSSQPPLTSTCPRSSTRVSATWRGRRVPIRAPRSSATSSGIIELQRYVIAISNRKKTIIITITITITNSNSNYNIFIFSSNISNSNYNKT